MKTEFENSIRRLSYFCRLRHIRIACINPYGYVSLETVQIWFSNISESQSITTVKQIFQFSIHAVYLRALVFKRASLCN